MPRFQPLVGSGGGSKVHLTDHVFHEKTRVTQHHRDKTKKCCQVGWIVSYIIFDVTTIFRKFWTQKWLWLLALQTAIVYAMGRAREGKSPTMMMGINSSCKLSSGCQHEHPTFFHIPSLIMLFNMKTCCYWSYILRGLCQNLMNYPTILGKQTSIFFSVKTYSKFDSSRTNIFGLKIRPSQNNVRTGKHEEQGGTSVAV